MGFSIEKIAGKGHWTERIELSNQDEIRTLEEVKT